MTRNECDCMLILQELADLEGGFVTPSLRELAAEMGGSSKSMVHRQLLRLRDKGYIRWSPRRARSIEILKRLPDPEHDEVEFVGTFAAVRPLRELLP